MIACAHSEKMKFGKDRHGNQRYKCKACGKRFSEPKDSPLGGMYTDVAEAKMVLRLLVEGNSLSSTARITGVERHTVAKLLVKFGSACRRFLDKQMRGLKLTHLQCDEQWTFVGKKQARLTIEERKYAYDIGDIYLWTAIDQKTKLMPTFIIGKRSADNARRFMLDLAKRLVFPSAHASDAHAFNVGGYQPIVQLSTDAFAAYREAVDLAFGPFVRFGTIQKEYRNASMIYTPSEMVGTIRKGIRGIDRKQERSICTSHVERLNGTQRLFMKRLNRLTVCFSKKLANLEAAFAMFACWYNFCWQTREKGTSGKLRPTAAIMAGIAGHVWSFDELFNAVLPS